MIRASHALVALGLVVTPIGAAWAEESAIPVESSTVTAAPAAVPVAEAPVAPPATSKGLFYLGLTAPYRSISGGDFKGDRYLTDGTEVILVPKLKPGLGVGLVGGLRRESSDRLDFGVEVAVIHSKHDAVWLGDTGDATYTSVSFDANVIFNRRAGPAKPYLSLGYELPIVVVKNGASVPGRRDDGILTGFGYALGAGVRFKPGERAEVTLGATYRYLRFTVAEGVSKEAKIDDALTSAALVPAVSLSYRF